MKKLFAKKQWMMLSLVAALGVAVYLNYYFTRDPLLSSPTGAGVSGEDSGVSDTVRDDGTGQGTESGSRLGEASFVSKPAENGSSAGGESDGKPVSGTVDPGAESYFFRARASRTTAREEAVRLLGETIGSVQATAEQQAEAAKKAEAIADNILQESNIENLILAKGFADCIAFIDGDSCSVVVQAEALQSQESLQILQIVTSQSDIVAGNVQISAVKG